MTAKQAWIEETTFEMIVLLIVLQKNTFPCACLPETHACVGYSIQNSNQCWQLWNEIYTPRAFEHIQRTNFNFRFTVRELIRKVGFQMQIKNTHFTIRSHFLCLLKVFYIPNKKKRKGKIKWWIETCLEIIKKGRFTLYTDYLQNTKVRCKCNRYL